MSVLPKDRHGDDVAFIMKKYGLNKEPISLSHNINHLLERPVHLKSYPPRESTILKEKIARLRGLSPDHIVLTAGASQGLYLLASYFVGKKVGILTPTYRGYEEAFQAYDVEILKLPLGMTYESSEIDLDLLKTLDGLIIGNPNNPTGSVQSLTSLIYQCKMAQCTLMVDESFMAFTDEAHRVEFQSHDHVIVIESLTKYQALAGVRLGLVLSNKGWIDKLKKRKPPWSVSGPALRLYEGFLEDQTDYKGLHDIEKAYIQKRAKAINYPIIMGVANFYLLPCHHEEAALSHLLNKGIYVRPLSNFDGHDFIGLRVAIGNREVNQYLWDILEEEYDDCTFNTPFAFGGK